MLPADIEDYIRPNSLPEALEHASKYQEGEAIFLAGGQSAMQAIKTRILRPRCIIDLQNISDLKEVAIGKNSTEFGSMTRYVEIAQKIALPPALAALKDACEHVGDLEGGDRFPEGHYPDPALRPIIRLDVERTRHRPGKVGVFSPGIGQFPGHHGPLVLGLDGVGLDDGLLGARGGAPEDQRRQSHSQSLGKD